MDKNLTDINDLTLNATGDSYSGNRVPGEALTALQEVMQAPLTELPSLLARCKSDRLATVYGSAIKFFLRANVAELAKVASTPGLPLIVEKLIELRLSMRLSEKRDDLISEIMTLCEGSSSVDFVWRAEAYFVMGMFVSSQGNDELCRDYYYQAFCLFQELGMLRRAARSYHNYIASLGRLDQDKHYISEFHDVVSLSKMADDSVTMSIALTNLSREYQVLGALLTAEIYATKAVDLARECHSGSVQYFQAIANRCDILIDLGNIQKAKLDFEELQLAEFSQITHASDVLAKKLQEKKWITVEKVGKVLYPTWVEREEQADPNTALFTPLEERLVKVLSEGAKSTSDLVECLYKPKGNGYEACENRLKQILYRVRKKAPKLIVRKGEMYMLND